MLFAKFTIARAAFCRGNLPSPLMTIFFLIQYIYHIPLVTKKFFSLQRSGSFYRTDLHLWDCFGREKMTFFSVQNNLEDLDPSCEMDLDL